MTTEGPSNSAKTVAKNSSQQIDEESESKPTEEVEQGTCDATGQENREIEEQEEYFAHYFREPGDLKLAVLGDISVRVNETYCLERPVWIHDNLLEFYLEYLRHVKHRSHKDDIEIVGPTVTQCIKLCDSAEVVSDMIEPLKLPEKKMVLIPVNNSVLPDSEGTHWSLLVLIPSEGYFYHLDTLDPVNRECAVRLAIKISKNMRLPSRTFENFNGTRQDNIVDCGLFVLLNADKAIDHFTSSPVRDSFEPAKKPDIANMRRIILHVIENISEQQRHGVPTSELRSYYYR